MRVAVLVAMTVIALSSTPLMRLAFTPAQEASAAPVLRVPQNPGPASHASAKMHGGLPGAVTQSLR